MKVGIILVYFTAPSHLTIIVCNKTNFYMMLHLTQNVFYVNVEEDVELGIAFL